MPHLPSSFVRGRVQPYIVIGDLCISTHPPVDNAVLYDWSAIVSQLLTTGNPRYRISGMYLEFQNVENPGDTVTPPSLDRTRTIAYYNELNSSADRDYLRVPLTAYTLASSEGRTNDLLKFFAASAGSTGVHGKTFSHVNNSVVYGASLVAIPEPGDRTQDLLFSSMYLPTEAQQAKLATSQIGLCWDLTLG